uniref:Fms related receptor tyrosine kinase 1 n=1 Tax=Naja naja TaxID=35670 RepID=A0A8C6YJF6_NAJNA
MVSVGSDVLTLCGSLLLSNCNKNESYEVNSNFIFFLIWICSGDVPHSWFLPETLSRNDNRLNIMTYACGRHNKQFCSSLTLNRAQANDTGYYSCKYPSSSEVKKKTVSKIYVFINDTQNPFIKLHTNIPEMIHTTDGEELIVPCRVTAPDIHHYNDKKHMCLRD